MALDDDTRHSERNYEARQRAADQLAPVVAHLMPTLLARWLEIKDEDLPSAREAIRDLMRARERREERRNETVMTTLKTVAAAAAGAAFTWMVNNIHVGPGKP